MQQYLDVDELVTGEAVALELPVAGIGARLLAGLIDLVLVGVLLTGGALLISAMTIVADEASWTALRLATVVLTIVGIPTAVETLTRGRSLGKVAVGLRTVRDDAGPIGFRQAFTRALVGVVEIWMFAGGPALIAALINPQMKRLGDLAAGTFVVRDRMRLQLPPVVSVPPGLAAWAATADIGRLPDRWAMTARQLILRGDSLTPAAWHRLATLLAAEANSLVAPAPPAGTTPDQVVRAVLATCRVRDAARLAEQQARRRALFPDSPQTPAGPGSTTRATGVPDPTPDR